MTHNRHERLGLRARMEREAAIRLRNDKIAYWLERFERARVNLRMPRVDRT